MKRLKKLLLSKEFPVFFTRLSTLLVLLCLLLALSFINCYSTTGRFFYIMSARELIYSAAGAASVSLAAAWCFRKSKEINK